MTTDTYSRPV